MRKWLLASFVVSWTYTGQPEVVPCPNVQPVVDQKTGAVLVGACLSYKDRAEEKTFKTKKEAEEMAKALEVLIGGVKVGIKEVK